MTIKNYNEVVSALAALLMQFDKDLNQYQTDVYLYYNEEEQTAELDTFVNVGGNSWLNDDHYTIYSDKEHYTDRFGDYFQTEQEFADALEMSFDDLSKAVRHYFEIDDDDELTFDDFRQYICKNDYLCKKCIAAYENSLEDYSENYTHNATKILDDFLNLAADIR